MKRSNFVWFTILGVLSTAGSPTLSRSAQQPSAGTVPVSTIVSVEAKHGNDIPVVNKEDVRVLQGKNRLQVTDWVPQQGAQGAVELLLLIDDASSMRVATELDDIRQFINSQPNTTAIGIAYMQNGAARIVQNFTKEHAQAAKALRMPLGSEVGETSPFFGVTDAIKHWPQDNTRHEIILISDGVDPMQPGATDTYLDETIAQAQQSGTQIYAIYAAHAGHFGHTLWRVNQGQSNLSRLADESGGEAYFEGLETPIAFAPFLKEIANRLDHQYKLTFLAIPGKKPGLEHVKLETEVQNAELVAPNKVYIPAAKQ